MKVGLVTSEPVKLTIQVECSCFLILGRMASEEK